ncbi:tripartite tricarboxylate transporter TctB family protein [Rhodobacteraceae bacterium LMO-12]|nr:tripartite tricarboxylate transporter TctB family protein [Rhodobacteraceae bacterium LMO-JJ12]
MSGKSAQAMTTDRILGLVVVVFAVLLYFVIVPWQVETVDYGWLKPRTLPRIVAVILGVCGVALILRPSGDASPGLLHWNRAALFAGVLIGALWVMSFVGFVYTAPVMALALMWLAHERRWYWLLFGVAGMPALIWFVVAILLERPLP